MTQVNIFKNVQSGDILCANKDAVEECPCLLRIIHAFKHYETFTLSTKSNTENIQFIDFCMQNYSTQCLDDYIHFISIHTATETLTKIRDYIHTDHNIKICTNIHECKSLDRHYRNRNDAKSSNSHKYSFYLETFEAIHCYLFHLEALGFRVPNNIEYKQSDDDLNCEDLEFSHLKQAVENRIKECNKLKTVCNINDLKFKITFATIPHPDNIEHKTETKVIEQKDNHDVIEFKWNKQMTTTKKCDTQHMLYLLSLAIEYVNERTIKRNQYFTSIQRIDRVFPTLNAAKIITNILNWHNKNKYKNKFDGMFFSETENLVMITENMSKICQISKGAATKIFSALQNQIHIQSEWYRAMPLPILKLKTIGYTKMYTNEKVLVDCTVEDIIELLSYENATITNPDAEDQGVFAVVVAKQKKGKASSPLQNIPDWKDQIINFFRENNFDGKKLNETTQKQVTKSILNALTDKNAAKCKSKTPNSKYRRGVTLMLRELGKRYVHGILSFGTSMLVKSEEDDLVKRSVDDRVQTRYLQTTVDRIYLASFRNSSIGHGTAKQLAKFLYQEEYDTDCVQYDMDTYYDDVHEARMNYRKNSQEANHISADNKQDNLLQKIDEVEGKVKCNISQQVPNVNFDTIEYLREFIDEVPKTFIDELLSFCAKKSKNDNDNVAHKLKMLIEKDEYDTDAIKEELKSKATKTSFLIALNNDIAYKKHIQQFADHYQMLSKHFSTGIVFWYWDWYKYNIRQQQFVYDQRWSSRKIQFGRSRHDLYVSPKYESIKAEALNCGISPSIFESEIKDKANQYINTSTRCKKMKNEYLDDPLHYGIKHKTSIKEEHLQAVILYCNFSDFCTSFRSSFRKTKWNETIRSVKARNSAYVYTSKYLRELIQYYGVNNVEGKQNSVRNTGPFWCGISIVMNVSSFSFHINGPLSTTVSRPVAVRFGGDNGMILEINNVNYPGKYERHFDTSWISIYPQEEERIWAGGVYPVELQSIKLKLLGEFSSYGKCINAFYKFDAILSGQKIEKISCSDFRWLKNCIDNYLAPEIGTINKYAADTFYLFCHKKTHIVLDLLKMEECLNDGKCDFNRKFLDCFMHPIQGQSMVGKTNQTLKSTMLLSSKKNNNKKNLFQSTIFKLFPNLQQIVIRITGGYKDTAKMYPFSNVSLKSLLCDDNIPKSLTSIIVKDRFGTELLQKFDTKSQMQLKTINNERWLCIYV